MTAGLITAIGTTPITGASADAALLLYEPFGCATGSLAGAAPTLDGTESLRLHLHENGSGTADFVLDEIRIATTLGEAMSIIPEPSASALPGLALMRRRQRPFPEFLSAHSNHPAPAP